MATYVVLESFLSKILLAQESNINYATEAEEKLIKKGYIFFPPKIIKPKKIESISSANVNNNAELFNPNISNDETVIKNDLSLTFQQQESEVSRLAAIQNNAEENKKIRTSLEEENRNASSLAIQSLSEKQIARAKQIEIEHEEHRKQIELDLFSNKKSVDGIIQSDKVEISHIKNIDVEKEKYDNNPLLNKFPLSNTLKLDKRNKFEIFLSKGSTNGFGIRFLSENKNSVEIIYSSLNALLSNYNDIGSISGSLGDNSVNLSANLGYNYTFNSKKVTINYLREFYDNTFLKSGLNFNSVEHDLNVYGNITSTYNNSTTTPFTYSNTNYIKLDYISPYFGLEYQKEISQIGLFIYGNVGIEYSPPSTFDSVNNAIDGKFKSYSSISSDINSIKRNVAKYQEIKIYSVGIKYKF